MTVLLQPQHRRSEFDCGNTLLTQYLHTQAGQDVKRRLAACYILPNNETTIIGYYTLSNNSIPLYDMPIALQQKLPATYTNIPAILLGRLAVDRQYKGQGWGKILLLDALQRCFDISHEIGAFAVIVDPLDVAAVQFYLKYGFIQLPESQKMFIAMKTLQALFQ